MLTTLAAHATVTATSDATLAEIDEKRFVFLVERTPHFALNVMRMMSQRLRHLNAKGSAKDASLLLRATTAVSAA